MIWKKAELAALPCLEPPKNRNNVMSPLRAAAIVDYQGEQILQIEVFEHTGTRMLRHWVAPGCEKYISLRENGTWSKALLYHPGGCFLLYWRGALGCLQLLQPLAGTLDIGEAQLHGIPGERRGAVCTKGIHLPGKFRGQTRAAVQCFVLAIIGVGSLRGGVIFFQPGQLFLQLTDRFRVAGLDAAGARWCGSGAGCAGSPDTRA